MGFKENEQVDIVRRWVEQFDRLETPRVYTRRLRMEDDQALYDAMKSSRVNRWISGFAQPFDLSAMRRWLAYRLDRMERGEGSYGGVFYRGSDVLLGFTHAVLEPELGGVEIAGAVQELYWGKGFVEEMGFALIADLFDAGVNPIVATTAMENYSSFRALSAFNFERVATHDIQTPNGLRPSLVFRLTPERFRQAMITPIDAPLSHAEVRAQRLELIKLCEDLKAQRAESGRVMEPAK
jgi:RimJ/RimL family protein N-acetyltransferase